MVGYARHEAYKESGVEWLGEIPEHWQQRKLKFVANIKTGEKDTVHKVDNGEYPFFIRSLRVERINTYNYDEEAVLTAGDGDIGKIFHYINGKFEYHQRVYKFSSFKEIQGKYLYYYLHHHLAEEVVKLSAKSTVDSLRLPMLQNFPVLLPIGKEQTRIANFLDQKTAEIDEAIAKKQRLIELLKEQKAILINQAVTQGLNPSAPMKNSGVEWIGDIPAHWEVMANRRVLNKLEQGNSPSIENYNEGSAYSVLKLSAVKQGKYISGEDKEIPQKKFREEYKVLKGDFLLTRGNTPELVADICYVSDEPSGNVMMPDLVYRLTYDKKRVSHEYFSYLMLAGFIRHQIKICARGSSHTMVKVSQEHIKSWLIVLPPIKEQEKINRFLRVRLAEIDKVKKRTQESIDKLQEFKQTLITHAVTGKIKV